MTPLRSAKIAVYPIPVDMLGVEAFISLPSSNATSALTGDTVAGPLTGLVLTGETVSGPLTGLVLTEDSAAD